MSLPYFDSCFYCYSDDFFILSAVPTFAFSSRANIFDNDLRKRFLPLSPSSKSSNSAVTVLLSPAITSKEPSVASVSSLSSFKCFSRLLVISSSMRQPSNSTGSFSSLNSMSLKRPSAGVFDVSMTLFFMCNVLFSLNDARKKQGENSFWL